MSKLIIAFLLSAFSLQAQIADNSITEDTRIYYWFSINIDKTVDRGSGTDKLYIRNIGNIENGPFGKFIEYHKQGLKTGDIAIGPFAEQSHALKSQLMYKYAGRESLPEKEFSEKDDRNDYAFFFIKPVAEDFTREISFEQIPCAVSIGAYADFMAVLNEGAYFKQLAVGPFYNYESAEKSKFVYLKNAQGFSDESADSLKSEELKVMAKKWKHLRLQISKKSDDKENNKIIYRFSTRFPRRYFAPDAFQVISIKANYSNSSQSSSFSFTLQGEDVVDNNPSVSSAMGTTYINVLNLNDYPDTEIVGFLFESFIYNNAELIELEPIYYEVK